MPYMMPLIAIDDKALDLMPTPWCISPPVLGMPKARGPFV